MQAVEMDAGGVARVEVEDPMRIWIECEDGSIIRGTIEILSDEGASVRLVGPGCLDPDAPVSVRIAPSRSAPILLGSARVLWVHTSGEAPECELEWTHAGSDRDQLSLLVSSLG